MSTVAAEPLAEVAEAAQGYAVTRHQAVEARRWLHEAIRDARDAGAPVAEIAAAAGLTRQRVYQTLAAGGAPQPLPGQLTVDTIGGRQ